MISPVIYTIVTWGSIAACASTVIESTVLLCSIHTHCNAEYPPKAVIGGAGEEREDSESFTADAVVLSFAVAGVELIAVIENKAKVIC